jgi:hypothetical protein
MQQETNINDEDEGFIEFLNLLKQPQLPTSTSISASTTKKTTTDAGQEDEGLDDISRR